MLTWGWVLTWDWLFVIWLGLDFLLLGGFVGWVCCDVLGICCWLIILFLQLGFVGLVCLMVLFVVLRLTRLFKVDAWMLV